MQEVKPPFEPNQGAVWLFLGGSIDQGNAEDWQFKVSQELSKFDDLSILNPRRDHWDPAWVQSKDNSQFREQVEWELLYQERANVIIYYFSKTSKSPITLLELGLFGNSSAFVFVFCPDGFYRKGNVDIVCEKLGIPVYETHENLINAVKSTLAEAYQLKEKEQLYVNEDSIQLNLNSNSRPKGCSNTPSEPSSSCPFGCCK